MGYKGSSPYDAGLFYCPYVPLQMVRAVGQDSFQPRIGFKTRYGMVANPFAEGANQGLGRSSYQQQRLLPSRTSQEPNVIQRHTPDELTHYSQKGVSWRGSFFMRHKY